jgi:hypothetical protein
VLANLAMIVEYRPQQRAHAFAANGKDWPRCDGYALLESARL